MDYSNAIRIEFKDANDANSCKESIMLSMDNIDPKSFGYSEEYDFGKLLREGLSFDGETVYYIDEEDYYSIATPEDMLELIPEMAKKIASDNPQAAFRISNSNTGTYTDSRVELYYQDNKLEIETVYYPEGDYENILSCPECGEEIVSMDEFEKGKTYVCPDCGEECELDDEYEEALPQKNNITITI